VGECVYKYSKTSKVDDLQKHFRFFILEIIEFFKFHAQTENGLKLKKQL